MATRLVRVIAVLLGSNAFACATPPPHAAGLEERTISLYEIPWVFRDEEDRAARLSDWAGTPMLVAPFYTACKLRCPRTIDKLREVQARFARAARPVNVVLVTMDPENDTPARLKAFKASRKLPASWHLLSGSLRETAEVARRFGVHPSYDEGHIDHEVRVGVVDARGNVVRVLSGWGFDDAAALP